MIGRGDFLFALELCSDAVMVWKNAETDVSKL